MEKCKSILAIILSLTLIIGACCGFTGTDVEIDVGDVDSGYRVTAAEKAVFLSPDGTEITSLDDYSKVTVTKLGGEVMLNCDYDDESGCYTFIGWYDGKAYISDQPSYTFIPEADMNLVAHIRSTNVLQNAASLEGMTSSSIGVERMPAGYSYNAGNGNYTALQTGAAPTGYQYGMFTNFAWVSHTSEDGANYTEIEKPDKNGLYCGDNYFPIRATLNGPQTVNYYTKRYTAAEKEKDPSLTDQTATAVVTPHTGDKMVASYQYFRSDIRELRGFEKNRYYRLSFWVYSHNDYNHINWAAVATNYTGLRTNSVSAYADNCAVLGLVAPDYEYGKWQQIVIDFFSGDNTVLYLHTQVASSYTNGVGTANLTYMDDITMFETESSLVTPGQIVEKGYGQLLGATSLSAGTALMNYTGSGIEFKAHCSGTLSLKMGYYSAYLSGRGSLRYKVVIDEQQPIELELTGSGTKDIRVIDGLESGVHNIRVIRETEPSIGIMTLYGVTLTGSFVNDENDRDLFIEFYGDSITAGYGTTNFKKDDNWPKYSNGTVTYAYKTIEALHANYNIFAYSGIGFCVGGGPTGNGETMAEKMDTLPMNREADIVVVNLGTNDAGKYQSRYPEMQYSDLIDKYAEFLQKMRETHPDSIIVAAYGAMINDANEFILGGIEKRKAAGDGKLYAVQLTKGNSGGAAHPDEAQQAVCGAELTDYLQKVLYSMAGDVNSDASVNLKDVVALTKAALAEEVELNEFVADANSDGKVNLKDAALVAQLVAGWENLTLKGAIYRPTDTTIGQMDEYVKRNGRTLLKDGNLLMDYSYTGFELNGFFSGDVTVNIEQNANMLLYGVVDNDFANAKQIITSGNGAYTLATVQPGKHTVRLIKATESTAVLTVTGVAFNGTLLKPVDSKMKIEFLGDSVTSASGLYTAEQEPTALLRNNAMLGFAGLTARNFDADCSVVSRSGGSAVYVGNNNPGTKLAGEYYKRTLFSDPNSTFAFDDTQPDVVVIALGTNDVPFYSNDPQALMDGIKALMAQVRAARPNATIVWGYEMMATNMAATVKQAVEEFAEQDGNAYYAKLLRGNYCTGGGGHPSPEGHAVNADLLTARIAEIMAQK